MNLNKFFVFGSGLFLAGIMLGAIWIKFGDLYPVKGLAISAVNAIYPTQKKPTMDWKELSLSTEELIQSEAYKGYEWTEDWVKDSKKNPSPGLDYAAFSLWKHKPYSSRYVKFNEDGYRNTINPLNHDNKPKIRIFVFGGSTIVGNGILRDEDLIPSILSKKLNKADSLYSFEVYNFAQSGFNQGNELVLLQRLLSQGNYPDLVVFYDGVNDTVHRVAFGVPHMAYDRFKQILSNDAQAAVSRYIEDKGEKIEKRIDELVKIYQGNLNVLSALSEYYGFEFMLFLQPTLFSKKVLSYEEKALLKRTNDYAPSLQGILSKSYRELFDNLKDHSHFSDISDAYGELNTSSFIDFVHVSPNGNHIVSQRLYEVLVDRFLSAAMVENGRYVRKPNKALQHPVSN